MTKRWGKQRGGVTLVLVMVLIVVAALVGAMAVRTATGDLRMSGSTRVSKTSFYCAEAGLNYAKPIIAANYSQWNTILSGGTPLGFTYPITKDLDGDGNVDVSVTIADNYDEPPPNANNPQLDNDLTVIATAQCVSSTLGDNVGQRTLSQIITYTGQLGTDYRYQAGHSSTHSGNEN